MKKRKKFDYNYLIIIIFCIVALYLIIPDHYVFGSKTDWISQHIVFPDYFRKLFYDTGNLFPNFAMAIGAGQNIYNFSYYGLLNPFILLSYLFPFIKMSMYLIIVNMGLYVFLGCISYYFFKTKFSKTVSFIGSLLLLLAAPILFHFHRHFMFVNYLPFLILGLIGTDQFFKGKGRFLVFVSVFFMITMSYYYSICGIAVLCIYALMRYFEIHKKTTFQELVKTGLSYLVPIIVGVLVCSILLVPTFYVLLTGRGGGKEIDFLSLLLPKLNLDAFLYGNYAIGLTVFSLLAVLYHAFCKEREKRWIGLFLLALTVFPIFSYLLNGTLYIRDKIFIPFIPIIMLVTCQFLEDILKRKIDFCKLFIIGIILGSSAFLCLYSQIFFYIDLLLTLGIIYLYYKGYTNQKLLVTILVMIPLGVMLVINYGDEYIHKEYFEYDGQEEYKLKTKEILKKEKDLVRFNTLGSDISNVNEIYTPGYNQDSLYSSVSNPLYQNFYKHIFKSSLPFRNNLILAQSNNILFQMFMGVKYIYSNKFVPVGYQPIDNYVYVNEDVFPVFYGTSQLTNKKMFKQLSYPYNLGTLLNSAVVDNDNTMPITNAIKEIKLDYTIEKMHHLKVKETENYWKIQSGEYGSAQLKLNQSFGKNILILEVFLANTPDCSQGDLKMTINGIDNVLTCKQWMYKNNNRVFHYIISSNEELDQLEIKFSKGVFKIKDIRTYQVNYEDLLDYENNMSYFHIDDTRIKNDIIEGSIHMKDSGYFITSIPYDKGFLVFVDGKKVSTEIVNTAFLGFPLEKGMHDIKIQYQSPGFTLGTYLSIGGMMLLMGMIFIDFKKRKNYGKK